MHEHVNATPERRGVKRNTRTFIIAVAALCVLVAVSLVVYHLPAELTLFDISGNKMTYISEDSEAFAAALTEDVTVYWLCADGLTDDSLSRFLLRYSDASDRISLRIVDTTETPDFASNYTQSTLSNYSLIVESARRYQIIDTLDMYYFTNEYIDYRAGSTYRMSAAQYDALYQTFGTYMDQAMTYQYFQGEALMTSALDHVTADLIPHTYLLTGHGDRTMSKSLQKIMDSAGVTLDELALAGLQRVPEDAGCIILFSPEQDLTKHEASLLKDHIRQGGSFLLVAGPNTSDFENLASVCALFGMGPSSGITVDTNTQCYRGETHLLVPLINSNHAAMNAIGSMGYLAYMPESMSITMDNTPPEGVTIQAMLGTSETGYRASKDSARTPLCDPAAQIVAAAAIMETVTESGTADNAYFAWFASDEAFTDEILQNTSYGNYYYLAMTAQWMTADEQFSSPYETLAAADLSIPLLNDLTTTSQIILGLVSVVIIPLGLLTIGLAVWLKRRNR